MQGLEDKWCSNGDMRHEAKEMRGLAASLKALGATEDAVNSKLKCLSEIFEEV